MILKNLFLYLFLFFSVSGYSKDFIVIQSTTSIANTGLLDLLASEFKNKTGISIRPIAVGTGNAIANAKRGDGDLLFVHSKKDELEFIEEGYGVQRYEVMYNKFILVGPKSDPLKISQEEDILSALKKIYNSCVVGFKEDRDRIPEIDILLEDNQTWKKDNFEAKIYHIPGHTTGHIAFHFFKEKKK